MNAKYINLFAAICILAIGVTILQTGRLIGQLSMPQELIESITDYKNAALTGAVSPPSSFELRYLNLTISTLEQAHKISGQVGNSVENCGYVVLLLDAIYLIAILIAIFRRKPPPPLVVLVALFIPLGLLLGNPPTANAQTELTPKCETPTLEGDPSCWLKVEEHDNCYIWIDLVFEEHTVTWSGQCQAGKAQGRGKETWKSGGGADTGTVNGIGSYLNGKRDGRWKIRWSRGAVDTGPYVDGKRHGQWKLLWSDGTMQTGPYVDGKRHGQWEYRYSDGGRGGTGPYVDGKTHGQWEYWYSDGRVGTGSHVDGKKHGLWETRDKDGNKECIEFSNNEQVRDTHKC